MKHFILFGVVVSILLTACTSQKMTTKRNIPFSNKVIAHRGAFKNTGTPENSLASLKAAIALGCGGAEFDIHMTADNILVINHDPEFLGIPIETTTYAQLQTKTLPNGEKIPTLEQYLITGLSQTNTKLIAEIKTSKISAARSLALATRVVEMVKKLKGQSQVVYIAFSYEVCKKVKALDPTAPVQYLNGDKSPAQLKADGLDADYHFSIFQKNPNWIQEARSIGIQTNAWTVNDEKVMDWLLAEKIDFITTNEPELLIKKIERK
ncbi:MAG TPA: glycerophosphodiester phosphodiesterase family protein [Niabella sp.]|nr:glycerophosphodiester phosphodiesterase family protein [Niabella sp.]HOZ97982.1 glycerophosphodiester phosphodiesterase family protein [Niabella sp.]HQW14134.1 glycerophosphodiester phosphodiesterase family protein [Niabella sp.]HQX19532.1 glycerophosphodiester phosphodiesterase family protein [Niabella sp.]HQX40032.1 glycerophosphodiester phosphodiesterase family protein [Niabella sp.]